MKNNAMKTISTAMRVKADEVLTELKHFKSGMFRLVYGLKTDSKEVDGGRCMRGNVGKMCFGEKERCNIWMDYMDRIMNVEID